MADTFDAQPAGDRIRLALDNLRPALLPGAEPDAAYKAQLILTDSQWLDRDEMGEYQLGHLKALVPFAARETPYWRTRIAPDAIESATTVSEALSRLPILSRDALHDDAKALAAENLPKGEVRAGVASSSGSTGMVVRVPTTKLDLRWQKILDLRGYLWAGLDLSQSLAVVHRMKPGLAEYPTGSTHLRWDPEADIPFPTGPLYQLSTHASLEQQWEWLRRIRPTYLYTRPSFVRGYAKLAEDQGLKFAKIVTTGEVVDPELRSLAASRLGAQIHDRYATQEAGCFAIQCPDAPTYHIQSEAIIVEVLDDHGRQCREGEIGRVVVTPLFNYAAPLLRYEIGDYAEMGGACSCGRSLPTLKRIMGRRRNMLVARDGRHYWPQLHGLDFYKVSECRQHQFRQISHDVIEMWLVVDSPRTPAQEEAMRKIVAAALPVPFEIRFRYVDEFPKSASGKHEELISYVADPPRG